eukprot:2070894-Rhodomonas_salina.1
MILPDDTPTMVTAHVLEATGSNTCVPGSLTLSHVTDGSQLFASSLPLNSPLPPPPDASAPARGPAHWQA